MKEEWPEQKRALSVSSVDSKFGRAEEPDDPTYIKGEGKSKLQIDVIEPDRTGFSKESFEQLHEGESIFPNSKIKSSSSISKEAKREGNQQSRIKNKPLRKDSAIDYVCWKSTEEDDEEICYPSSSLPASSTNVKNKKKTTKEPIYDELTCPSCSKTYNNPVLLPCDHCICESCIPKQKDVTRIGSKKHAVITCPTCQEKNYFTSSEKVKFPNNFLLDDVINKIEMRKKKGLKKSLSKYQPSCQLCEKKNKQAAVKCENCDLNFCKDCLKQHDKTYTNHSFVLPSTGEDKNNCFYHPDTLLTLFCLVDKIPICEEGLKDKHKGHATVSIQTAFKDQSIHLLQSIGKYGKVKDESENDLLRLSIFKSQLKENKDKFHKQVSSEFESLHNQLRVKEKEVKAIHDSELNMKLTNINNFMDDTAKHIAGAEGLVQYAKQAARETDELVLLQTVNHLTQKLKEKTKAIHLSDKELMTTPVDVNAFDFGHMSQQINDVFQPITDKYELVKGTKVSTILKKKASDPVAVQPERVESKTADTEPGIKTPEVETPEVRTPRAETPEVETPEAKSPEVRTPELKSPKSPVAKSPEAKTPEAKTPEAKSPEVRTPEVKSPKAKTPKAKSPETKSEVRIPEAMESEESIASSVISQEHIFETHLERDESIEGFRNISRLGVDNQKKTSELHTKMDTPVPPTIYHHIVSGTSAKIFWMVPEYDTVDSFDVHFQEVGHNNGLMTPQKAGVVISAVNASSFETTLKDNSEAIFKVRAVNSYGKSEWSYPYRVILRER